MSNFAKVIWANGRFELWIDRILKGYSQGENDTEHESGRDYLVKAAEQKGYAVHVENRQ